MRSSISRHMASTASARELYAVATTLESSLRLRELAMISCQESSDDRPPDASALALVLEFAWEVELGLAAESGSGSGSSIGSGP